MQWSIGRVDGQLVLSALAGPAEVATLASATAMQESTPISVPPAARGARSAGASAGERGSTADAATRSSGSCRVNVSIGVGEEMHGAVR